MQPTDTPLPAAALHILLAIGPGERHGYAIMADVAAMTDGLMRLAPGTLYTNIKRLLANGLIEEVGERPDAPSDEHRRRYYRLTLAGRRVVSAEVQRMQALVVAARPWLAGVDR